jgi:hypothetical protein
MSPQPIIPLLKIMGNLFGKINFRANLRTKVLLTAIAQNDHALQGDFSDHCGTGAQPSMATASWGSWQMTFPNCHAMDLCVEKEIL